MITADLKKIILEYDRISPFINGEMLEPRKTLIENFSKIIHIKRQCKCSIIIKTGNFYFCPCCRTYIDTGGMELDDDDKLFMNEWLINTERIIDIKPFYTCQLDYDYNLFRVPLYGCIQESIERKSKKIILSVDDNCSTELLADILEQQLSLYMQNGIAKDIINSHFGHFFGSEEIINEYLSKSTHTL